MDSISVSLICAVCILGSSMLGMYLRGFLPKEHLRDESKDAVKVGAGMVATMAALVLGLLVGSAKQSFDTVNSEVTQNAAKFILLDRVLANYGPETKGDREILKNAVAATLGVIWPEDYTMNLQGEVRDLTKNVAGSEAALGIDRINYMETLQMKMFELTPTTEGQRVLLGQAQQLVADLRQARWLLLEQTQTSLPVLLLVALVFWLTMLHLSFGLFSPRNATVIFVLTICAISVSSALFIIMELNHPMHGIMKVSGAPMRNAFEHMGN